jgi:hypothetical protein
LLRNVCIQTAVSRCRDTPCVSGTKKVTHYGGTGINQFCDEDSPVSISIGDPIFSNSVPYVGTGSSKLNVPLDDELICWSIKGNGTMEKMTTPAE